MLQFIIAAAYLVSVSMAGGTTETLLPFIGTVDLGVFYYFIAAVLIVGMVNAVNFTDGLDGLFAATIIAVISRASWPRRSVASVEGAAITL